MTLTLYLIATIVSKSTGSILTLNQKYALLAEAFMVLELKPGVLSNVSGIVRYPAYFDAV